MSALPLVELVVSIITAVLIAGGLPALAALMSVESFGIPPLPSEVILPFAGFLVAQGTYSYGAALGFAVLGGLVGSYAAYAVGRWGRHLLVRPNAKYLKVEERHLNRMDGWFSRYGEVTVAGARLLPIVRSYISYPAGTARMEPVRFGVYTTVGSIPFTAALIYAGVLLGKNWDRIQPVFSILDDIAVVVIVAVAAYLFWRWRRDRLRRKAGATPYTGPLPPAGAAPPSATAPRSPPP